ncbi:MAG: OAM dimerization domain-containing protein [Halanaerobiales bacterium]|nr:OAM dimerization domain-containing protein [Halanaerobiales bacterium]
MDKNNLIKAYGDTYNDGKIQLSFTLPIQKGLEAEEAARKYCLQLGLKEVEVVHMRDLSEGFTFFVVYAISNVVVDKSKISVAKIDTEEMSYYEINDYIKDKIKRKLTVVGACTGTDAHTVGLDAILNMKGYAGEYGLERYPQYNTFNLGSQVPNEALIKKAVEVDADAVLISQVVTQKDIHIKNLTEFVEILEAEGLRDNYILVLGGPRISHELALELGFDAGFGSGTKPNQVASYIAQKVFENNFKDGDINE